MAAERRSHGSSAPGAYDSPWPIAEALAQASLTQLLERRAVWGDPFCGAGRLIVAAWERIEESTPPKQLASSLARVRATDLDPDALAGARAALRRAALATCERIAASYAQEARALAEAAIALDEQIGVRDVIAAVAAGGPLLDTDATGQPVVILTNPPFGSMRSMRASLPTERVETLQRIDPEVCIGAWDMAVPLVARLVEYAQRPGSRVAVVLPASFETASYARGLRSRFEDGVVWGRIEVEGRGFDAQIETVSVCTPPPHGAERWPRQAPALPRSGLVALGDIATVAGGTPGFEARATADALVEGRPDRPAWPFVTSGAPRPEEAGRLVRFMKRDYRDPWLPRASVRSEQRRALFDRPKAMIPGVSRGMRAFDDPVGSALGVGMYAVVSDGAPPSWWTAVLNHPSASEWWLRISSGNELSGGYRRVSAQLLRTLPVPDTGLPAVRAAIARIASTDRAPLDAVATAELLATVYPAP